MQTAEGEKAKEAVECVLVGTFPRKSLERVASIRFNIDSSLIFVQVSVCAGFNHIYASFVTKI